MTNRTSLRIVFPALLAGIVTAAARGQDVSAPPLAACRGTVPRLSTSKADRIEKTSDDFVKLGFGTGYGAAINLDARTRVEEASIVGGVVRVTKDDDVAFGPVLEAHKFYGIGARRLVRAGDEAYLATAGSTCGRAPVAGSNVPLVGFGPFVALRIGGDEIVQSFGAGIMFGFRKADGDKSLNLGLAYATDPRVRTLGDGVEEGKALPAGETEIRFKTTHQDSLILMFSVGW